MTDKIPNFIFEQWREKKPVQWKLIALVWCNYVRGSKNKSYDYKGDRGDFPIDIGFHQGLALNPFLFTIVMDEHNKGIQDEIFWCMHFAHDVVLIDGTREGFNNKLEQWRATL